MKVGVVYVSPVADIGWTKQHSLGAQAIKDALGDKVELTIIDNIFMPQDAERVFTQLASSGNKLVFGTSFSHGTPMQKVAPRFPDVAFEHCSGIVHLANLGTFEAKYYEGTFVAGAAAGVAGTTAAGTAAEQQRRTGGKRRTQELTAAGLAGHFGEPGSIRRASMSAPGRRSFAACGHRRATAGVCRRRAATWPWAT